MIEHATSPLPFLTELVAFVIASAAVAYVCQRVRILPIVGFLIAGVLIGPNAIGLVRDPTLIDAVAEIGVILLLFTLGIEFSLERLWRIRRLILIAGTLQLVITTGVTAGILVAVGVEAPTSIFTGCLVALSSTAIVLKVLEANGETGSGKGEISVGILIFQDLAIIALVLFVPILAGESSSPGEIVITLLKALGIVIMVLLVARRVMPFVLERVARTCAPEIFLLTVVAICLGMAWITSLAGVSLSLGAFLAGLVVSESRFSHQAFGEVLPLQMLFTAAFFVSVGMLLDVPFVLEHPLVLIAAVAGVILLKTAATATSALLAGRSLAVALASGLLLAQIGEFSFVLQRVGRPFELLPAGVAGMGEQMFIAASVILMIVTPILARGAQAIEQRSGRGEEAQEPPEPAGEGPALENHVIIAGYGAAARDLARVLRRSRIPMVILTLSPTGATEAEGEDLPVVRGNYSRPHLLELAGVEAAKVLAIPDDEPPMARRVASIARALNPSLRIFVRTRLASEIDTILADGADDVVADERESSHRLLSSVLAEYDVGSELRTIRLTPSQRSSPGCPHGRELVPEILSTARGCSECLSLGDPWVELRICMTCGSVGCCDSSKNRHATHHHHSTGHPIVRSYEKGEEWAWCYADRLML